MFGQKLSRETRIERIRAWLAEDPENHWAALLAEGLEPVTIKRIIDGKLKGAPQTQTRRAFMRASNKAESWFFPPAATGKKTG